MKQQTAQQGSAHVVIIVILVVVLVGALGWIFWQNFLSKDDAKTDSSKEVSGQTAKADESKVSMTQGSVDPDFGTTVTFEYPDSWKYESSTSGEKLEGMWSQLIGITSPSGKYVVTYNLNQGGGIGGACTDDDAGTVASLKYDELKGFSGASYAEYSISNSPNETEVPGSSARLISTETAKSVSAGDSECKLAMVGVFELSNLTYLTGAYISVSSATTSEEFEKALSGKEYEQAKAILLSTKH